MPPNRPLNEVAASFGSPQGTSFSFSSADTAQPAWTVRKAHLREAISEPYCLRLELVANTAHAAPVSMLGKDAQFSWDKAGFACCVQGIVTRVEDGDSTREIARCHVTVEPVLAALGHTTSSRIFEQQSIPDVVKAVLLDRFEPFGRSVVVGPLEGEYPVREYIAQHRETDLDFVARLLAKHGLWCYFEHRPDEKLERLVIADSPKQAPAVAKDPDIRLSRDKDTTSERQAVTSLGASDQLRTTGVRIRYFDWTVPRLPIEVTKRAKDPAAASLERYEHGDVTSLEYKEPRYGKDDSEAQAQVRLDAYRSDRHSLTGASNVVCLRPGHFMKVAQHEYLITSVTHHGDVALNTGQAAHLGDYRNGFTCVLREQAYRPARKPKPRIQGPQTAIVVNGTGDKVVPHSGAGGSDISTDKHGRVRVKFHWDTSPTPEDKKQEGTSDKVSTTSAWIRVAQGWAGTGWGIQFIPRVGMEVIVHFIDGDPDRPIITGCVYNGQNWPPYRDKPTQSGIKTASSVDRERYNELRFDDASGAEQVFVRAQRNLDEEVLNDHTTTVTGKQTQTVKKSQTENVQGDATLSVGGKRTKTVGGDKEHGEENTIKGERLTTVTKKNTEIYQDEYEQTVTAAVTITHNDTRTTNVKKDDVETISEGNKATSVVAGAYEVRSAKALTLVQNGEHALQFDNKVHLQTSSDFTITNGKTQVASSADELQLSANSGIKIACGQAQIELKKDGTINITGTKISLTAGNNSVVADQTGVTVSGVKVSSTAVGIHEIQGAMIKIG